MSSNTKAFWAVGLILAAFILWFVYTLGTA